MTLSEFCKMVPISNEVTVKLCGKTLDGLPVLNNGAYQRYSYPNFVSVIYSNGIDHIIKEISVNDNMLEIHI